MPPASGTTKDENRLCRAPQIPCQARNATEGCVSCCKRSSLFSWQSVMSLVGGTTMSENDRREAGWVARPTSGALPGIRTRDLPVSQRQPAPPAHFHSSDANDHLQLGTTPLGHPRDQTSRATQSPKHERRILTEPRPSAVVKTPSPVGVHRHSPRYCSEGRCTNSASVCSCSSPRQKTTDTVSPGL